MGYNLRCPRDPLENFKVSQRSNELHLEFDLWKVCQKYQKVLTNNNKSSTASADHLEKLTVTKSGSVFEENLSFQRTKCRFCAILPLKFIFLRSILANPDRAPNSFSVLPPQTFHNFPYPCYYAPPFLSYSETF